MEHKPTFEERTRALGSVAEMLTAFSARLREFAVVIQRETELMQAAQLRFAARQKRRTPVAQSAKPRH